MFDSSGWTPYLAVIAISCAVFVFVNESLNPFQSKKHHSHRRRKLAKSLALIFFLVVTNALMVKPYLDISQSQLVLVATVLCIMLAIFPLKKFFRSKKAVSPILKIYPDQPIAATRSPIIAKEAKVQAQPFQAIADPVTQDATKPEQLNTTPEPPSISRSDEYQLELEITDLDSDFDDLDQSIAEADFTNSGAMQSETNTIAQPSQPNHTDDVGSASDISADLLNGDSVDCSNPKPANTAETLLQILDTKNKKIQHLVKSNQSLIEDRVSLTDEVNDLKFSLQKVNTIARKGIAQRDQAIKTKNNALTLAAMEKKKRQLTEIKARKALMKMSNSIKALTNQNT